MTEPQPSEVLALTNKLLDEAGIIRNLTSLRQCNSSVFCSLFEVLTGGRVPGIAPGACISEAVRNQAVVSALSRLLPPEVTLDHIHGSDLARGDLVSLKNLLDIFAVLLRLPCSEDEETEEDSNLLSVEALQIVDQVLQENLAQSCSSSSHSTEKLLRPLSPPSFPPAAAKVLEAALPVSTEIYPTPACQSLQTYPLRHSTPHKGPRTRLAGPADDVCASYVSPQQPGAPPLSISSLTSSSPSVSPEVQRVSPSTSTKDVGTSTHDVPTTGAVMMPSPPCSPHSLENGSAPGSPVATSIQDMLTERAAMISPPGSPCSMRESGAVASSSRSPARHSHPGDVTATEETEQEEVSSTDAPHRKSSAHTRKEVVAALVRNYLGRDGRVRYPGPSKVKEKHSIHTPKTKRKGKALCRNNKPAARRETWCEDVSDIPIMALVEEALPGAHCSPATARRLWQSHVQQQMRFVRSATRTAPTTAAQRKLMDMEQQHSALLQQIKKDLGHARRMQAVCEQRHRQRQLLACREVQRQSAARARRYYQEYELGLKARLQKKRTREEQIFKKTFEECLRLQKDKVREMKRYAKEKQLAAAQQHLDHLQSMDNYYHDQLAMLVEGMTQEQRDVRIREKAEKRAMERSGRELRQKMEQEIKELHKSLDTWENDCTHFRQLDSDMLCDKFRRTLTI